MYITHARKLHLEKREMLARLLSVREWIALEARDIENPVSRDKNVGSNIVSYS